MLFHSSKTLNKDNNSLSNVYFYWNEMFGIVIASRLVNFWMKFISTDDMQCLSAPGSDVQAWYVQQVDSYLSVHVCSVVFFAHR